mmetsp:Transcript_45659/g.114885  ORF Transcript_45659/g.114885 Transcript_45659/m.114885 type:complete len:294 (+) Transcript_45659:94-975(+)
MSVDIKLSRVDRIYRPGEIVDGVVVVNTKGSLTHSGISLSMLGDVQLQISSKSQGLFDAFYNSIKPLQIVYTTVDLARGGKIADGTHEIPFEFKLVPLQGQTVYETYHGVFVNISYHLKCTLARPLLAKDLERKLEFIVEGEVGKSPEGGRLDFVITPQTLQNTRKIEKIPPFRIAGWLANPICHIHKPFLGELTIQQASCNIRSIELQLVRVETCGCSDGFAKEATEIQNIQIADGDICRDLPLPIYMVFPRLFTCPTTEARTFKIEFEVNVVIMMAEGHSVSQNFPITVVR